MNWVLHHRKNCASNTSTNWFKVFTKIVAVFLIIILHKYILWTKWKLFKYYGTCYMQELLCFKEKIVTRFQYHFYMNCASIYGSRHVLNFPLDGNLLPGQWLNTHFAGLVRLYWDIMKIIFLHVCNINSEDGECRKTDSFQPYTHVCVCVNK
jgi:hypothetical protein